MDAELPLGFSVSEPAPKLGSSTQITGQMTLSSDSEGNWKQPLAYLGWRIDADLPLGLGMSEPAADLDPGHRYSPSIFEKVSLGAEKKIYSFVFGWNVP